ncbi:50S ribosomal protein L15 [Candidatus Kaiserbacteria bacterium]|nr:50S ribosomal protein L15 [Candidatus Kaiserbacteria bacterium]
MQLHQLKPKTVRKTARRIGRGGKRGKTSGRGGKGQTARTGNSTRPEMRDLIKKLPKLRGHGKNRARTVNAERVRPTVINLSVLDGVFEAGSTVDPRALLSRGLIHERGGRLPTVKILADGDLSKKLTVVACAVSAAARTKIEARGGSVQ